MPKYLFLSLSRKGWGEAILGRRIASELRTRGHEVRFICHESMEPLFRGGDIPFASIPEHIGPFVRIYLEAEIVSGKYRGLLLSDFFTCEQVFQSFGFGTEVLLKCDIPVAAIDTWDSESTGTKIDIFGKKTWVAPSLPRLMQRIVPVPFALPSPKRRGLYCNMPPSVHPNKAQVKHLKHSLGLTASTKLILLSTAVWQQTEYNDNGNRLAARIPELLDYYLSTLDPRVHVLHIGPRRIRAAALDRRYHWFPQVNSDRFNLLLGSADVVLSLNISATTIATAIASGVPVVVLQNSLEGGVELADSLSSCSEFVHAWLACAAPLYKFRMWPLGFYAFLDPLIDGSQYVKALRMVEILDEPGVREQITRLLELDSDRHALIQAQADYVRLVQTLPSGGDAVLECFRET